MSWRDKRNKWNLNQQFSSVNCLVQRNPSRRLTRIMYNSINDFYSRPLSREDICLGQTNNENIPATFPRSRAIVDSPHFPLSRLFSFHESPVMDARLRTPATRIKGEKEPRFEIRLRGYRGSLSRPRLFRRNMLEGGKVDGKCPRLRIRWVGNCRWSENGVSGDKVFFFK